MIRFEDDNKHSVYWYDSADVAKFLNIRNPNTKRIVGRNLFMQFLRYNGVLLKDSNQPNQMWINLGLAKFHMVTKRYKVYGIPIFSETAISYIENRIVDGRLMIGFEKRLIKEHESVKEISEVC